MDDAESAGIGVVDGDLLAGELMLDELVLDAFIGKRAGGIEAERLQVAGQDFHGGDPAGLDRLDEFGAGGEGEILAAPQAEALRVSQVLDLGRAGGGDVDDAGLGQSVLQPQAGAALLRGGDGAAAALAAGGVGHGVRLVEDDDAVEIRARASRRSAGRARPCPRVPACGSWRRW